MLMGNAVHNGPRIVISPMEQIFYVNAQYPESKVLSCQTAGEDPGSFSQLRWTGPDRTDNWDELSKRHSVTKEDPNSNIWDLEFKNPTNDDSGVYYCHGKYMSEDALNASIRVKVYNPIKLESCPDRQFVVEGSRTAKITCRITADSPRIILSKDNMPMDNFGNRYKWNNDDALVINAPVDKRDAGKYTIRIISSDTGELKLQVISVEVHTRPQIVFNDTQIARNADNLPEFYGVEGDTALLKCEPLGNPRPLVYWLDPRMRNLTHVGGYHVNAESGTLLIDKVDKRFDHGVFECKAHNTVDEVSQKVFMSVDTKPLIVAFDNKTVDEGDQVILECRASGEPQPDFSIRKHGLNQKPYQSGDGTLRDQETRAEGGGSNMWVHRETIVATRQQYGLHYCNATNRAHTAEKVGQLFVNYAPDLSLTPPEQFVPLGKRITVTCHIRAYPAPTVTWLTDNIQLINLESNIKTSPDGQTHIVTMSPPNQQQTATSRFVCRASNKMGIREQSIMARFTTPPGIVIAQQVERLPTSVKLQLHVPVDGGDRIKAFKYKAEGRTLDFNNPTFSYRIDRHNETIIDASLNSSTIYTIRNLLPHYSYRISIRAVNDVGEGDATEIHMDTLKPTPPEPPIIIRPGTSLTHASSTAVPSEYQNGYLLRWSPPESDNGDPVTKYVIKTNLIDSNALDMPVDSGDVRIIEQMNERPMYARLGPLEPNRKYRVQVQARNMIGDSEPAYINVYTTADRPRMPEFDALSLAWLTEPSTPVLYILLAIGLIGIIIIDLVFCFCFDLGVTFALRNCCCPPKTNSVISDKNYT